MQMRRSSLIGTVAVCAGLGLCTPLLAATPPDTTAVGTAPSTGTQIAAAKPSEKCMGDVRALNNKMNKEGYWLGEDEYGYGYSMGAYSEEGPMVGQPEGRYAGSLTARPGYEIRTLVASANILARNGQEQGCEDALATSRTLYSRYAADLHGRGVGRMDGSGWRKQQIAAAKSVTAMDVPFRSDQLIDNDVVSPANETLGSVHDLVISPQTGKIAYVVIARGGLFGIDESYTPVPWGDFKATPNGSLLVLDTTKAAMSAAPQAGDDQFTKSGQFSEESAKVDAYWATRIKSASANN
jgi:hypothetical protein